MMIAFDRSERYKDQDGNLHVRVTNLSKATVNGYRGREIPGWETLGLDAERTYQLLRHPDELAAGAETFNNLRLLSKHVAVSAADPKEELVAGSTGTDAKFADPYLTNSLVIWRAEDIADIESGDKCQLSCAYYYIPDMTPGTYQGLRYDGVMRTIRGNHVALVEAGRAGPDVMVHDSMEALMPLSPHARLLRDTLTPFLRPRLMPGTVLALDAALGSVNGANWRTQRPKVLEAITGLVAPKLAKDANLDDLPIFLGAFDGASDETADDDECEAMDAAEAEEENAARKKERDEGKSAEDRRKGAKDRKAARDAARTARDAKAAKDAKKAKDAESESEEERKKREAKEAEDAKAKDGKAMDSAIKDATEKVRADLRAAAQAREDVRPLIGQVSTALDSADAIYKLALDHAKVDTAGVPPAAFPALVKMIPKPGATPRTLALDAAPAADLASRFPAIRQRVGA